MFLNRQLQLIQPKSGNRLGVDLLTEKWVLLKFQAGYVGPTVQAGAGFYDFLGSMVEYPVMGRYSILANDTGASNTSYVIGRHGPPGTKVWQYNPANLELHLGTLETWTGTPETNNQTTYKITDDVVLYSVMLRRNGFELNGAGTAGYGTGFANIASWTHQPFEQRSLFWTSL